MAVDVPVDCPDLGWNLIEQIGLFDQIAELGAKDFRESFDGDVEILRYTNAGKRNVVETF